jgi:hypothetical protein
MPKQLGLLLGLAVTAVATTAQAIPIANGDLIVVLQKSGTEVIVNLGSFASTAAVDLSGAAASLGGSLEGAKVVAVGVEEPGRQTPDFGFGPLPQENILFSSLSAPVGLTDAAIEVGMNSTDTSLASAAWFWQLRSASSNVVQTSQSFSYQLNLGLGTDAIANSFPFSIAGIISGGSLTLGIYSAVRGYEGFDPNAPATEVRLVGSLAINGNSLSYVPEPGTLLLVAAGLAGLAAFDRRARRA